MIKSREKYISIWFFCCFHLETRQRVFSSWYQWWMIKWWSDNVEHERRLFIINIRLEMFICLSTSRVFIHSTSCLHFTRIQTNVVYFSHFISSTFFLHRHLIVISSSHHLTVISSHLSSHLTVISSHLSSHLIVISSHLSSHLTYFENEFTKSRFRHYIRQKSSTEKNFC
jgi:hypothetical protein